MKANKITYWLTTGLLAVSMLASFFNYMFNPAIKIGFAHIGFPDWFRMELGVAKLLGAIALIVLRIPARIKEWAYFGFFVNFISAILAHLAVNDPVVNLIAPLAMLVLLVTSYLTYYSSLFTGENSWDKTKSKLEARGIGRFELK
jgi:hypothetical protein